MMRISQSMNVNADITSRTLSRFLPGQNAERFNVLRACRFNDIGRQLGSRRAACSSRSVPGSRERTACRTKAAACRARIDPAGQNREESGVSISSTMEIFPSMVPNSNFVSQMMMPRFARIFDAPAVERQREFLQSLDVVGADDSPGFFFGNFSS